MKKMRRVYVIVAIAIVVIFALGLVLPAVMTLFKPTTAIAATSSDKLKEDLKKNNDEIERLRKEMEDLKTRKAGVLDRKALLDKEVFILHTNIETTTNEIALQEADIINKEKQIKTLESDIVSSNDLLKERLRVMYEQGNATYLDVLFSSSSISDLLTRIDMVQQLMAHDQALIDQLESVKLQVTEAKNAVVEQQRQKETMRTMLTGQKNDIEAKVRESEALIKSLENDAAENAAVMAQREKDEKAFQAAIAAAEQSAQKPAVVYSGGKLGWPAPAGTGTVTSPFGMRKFRGVDNNHTGLDIGVNYGTAVLAAADGVVSLSSWNGSYGYCVIINHGSISTLYGHNSSLVVNVGDQVKRGDTIAKAGSTGNSTGNHIHFGVINNSTKQYLNPSPYLFGE